MSMPRRHLPECLCRFSLFSEFDVLLCLSICLLSNHLSLRVFTYKGNKSPSFLFHSVWGSPTAGFEVSPEASSWFSRFLKEPGVRLVKFTSKCKNRPTQVAGSKGSYLVDKYPIRYQDGSPVHLCNETTLDELNVIAQPDGKKFVMLAFRPNITVKSPIPKEELSWYSCTIDSVTFNNVRACTRCAVPTVDVLTGERDPDKTKLMFNHRSAQDEYERKNYSKNPMFGINLVPQKTGRINLGSSVDVCI